MEINGIVTPRKNKFLYFKLFQMYILTYLLFYCQVELTEIQQVKLD
jgi:hypothetical protein